MGQLERLEVLRDKGNGSESRTVESITIQMYFRPLAVLQPFRSDNNR